VLALLDAHLVNLGGTHGDPSVGEPVQYDELRIEHDRSDVARLTAVDLLSIGNNRSGNDVRSHIKASAVRCAPRA
jgi:hypothetical protein